MSDNIPPNVPIFNGINYNSQFFSNNTDGLTYDQASKLFLTFPGAQGNESTNYDFTVNGSLYSNTNAVFSGNLVLNSQTTTKKRIYQELNPSWLSTDGYYELAQDAFPMPNKSSSSLKAISSWDLRTTNTNQWFGVCWSPQLAIFCAVSTTGTTNRIMTSPDCVNWTLRTTPNNLCVYRKVAWSPYLSLFVVVGTSTTSTDSIMTSPDGITWTSLTPPNTSNWFNIVWSEELKIFVAISDTGPVWIMTSTNGTTWVNRGCPTSNNLRGIAWSAELGLFIIVASNGVNNRILKSTDGLFWNVVPSDNSNWYSVAWSKELGQFCACSISGTSSDIMISSDGDNWSLQTTPNTNGYRNICWCSNIGTYIAVGIVGSNNRIITSYDGKNWISQTSNNNDWRSVCYSNELGVACAVSSTGNTTGVMTSSLLGRPPTSYNVFNNTFNSIDVNGNWMIKAKSLFSSDSDITITPLTNLSLIGNLNMNNKNITNASTIYLNDNSVANMLLKYLDSTGELGFTTTKTGGKYNFYSFDGTSNVSLFELQQTQLIPKVNMAFPANINLTMASGSGLITQSPPISLSTTVNTFRMTNILSNYGGTSASSTCQMYDTVIGRGFLFVVNGQGGNYNPLVGVNDCIVTTRFRPTSEAVGITLAAQCAVGCGIRVYSPTDPQAQVTLRAGTSTIVMSNYATNPISVNDRIYMGNTTLTTRRIDNVSVLNLFDTSNTSGFMEMLVDSPSSTVQYRSLTNNYYHLFYATNGSGVTNSRFSIADGNVSTIGCPLYIRNAITTLRCEITPNADGSTDFVGTNSSSLNSSINIKLRNSSNVLITTQVFTPTLITENVPTNTTSVTPSLSSQNGYVGSNVYSSPGNITSSTTIGNFFSFTFTDVGTYSCSLNRQLSNADGSTITVNQWYSGFSATTNTIDIPSGGSLYSTSTLRQYTFTIPATTDLSTGGNSMILRINAPNTTIYFNGFISHTATNLGLRVVLTYAKIY